MRICNLLEEGSLGGPQRRSIAVARALADDTESEIETVLVFSDSAEDLASACREHAIPFEQIPMDALSKKPTHLIQYILTFVPQLLRLKKLLTKRCIDVVHVSGGSFCYKGPVAARLARTPYVWHLNNTNSRPIPRAVFWIVSRLAKPALLIYAGSSVEQSYKPWIPKGVPTSIVPAPHPRGLTCSQIAQFPDPYDDSPKRVTRVLLLANLNPIKGIDIAIRALAQTKQPMRLFVAGGIKSTQDEYARSLQALAGDLGVEVVFLGLLKGVIPHLLHADISLCSSRAEASPLSVWEAAAAGNAIVSTRVGDVPIFLPHEVGALLVDVEDATAMAAALDKLATDYNLRVELGAKARQAMETTTAIDVVAKKTAAVYQRAFDKR